MKEYTITMSYVVDARDHDEAVEIAKEVLACIETGKSGSHGYKLRQVETSKIEEL